MKLAFSTLGCPDFDWSDIYSIARTSVFRIKTGDLETIFSRPGRPFQPENIDKTICAA
jgi:fatty-acyl-CoA synthase